MNFSALTAIIDDASREILCDPVELRPVAGGEGRVVPAMIDEPMEPTMSGPGAPMLQATVEIEVAIASLKVGDVLLPGSWLDGIVGGQFVPMALGWRVAGAPTRDVSGRWQKATLERYRP